MSIYSTNIFHFSPRTIFLLIHFFFVASSPSKKKFFFLLLFETRSVHVSIVFPFYYAFFTFPFPYHTCACLYKHIQTLRKFSILILSREARTEGNRAFIDFFFSFKTTEKIYINENCCSRVCWFLCSRTTTYTSEAQLRCREWKLSCERVKLWKMRTIKNTKHAALKQTLNYQKKNTARDKKAHAHTSIRNFFCVMMRKFSWK